MKRHNQILIFIISMLVLVTNSACVQKQPYIKPSFTIETFPRVDGSTVTIPITEALMAELTGKTLEEVRPYVLHTKTHGAYMNLISKFKDLIFVTSPSAEELQIAQEAGVELEIVPIVAEAFVFIINKDNPITSLTLDQIQKIYTGEITNWKEVGGDDVAIKAYQRPANSGSQTGFLDLVMKEKVPMAAPTELLIQDMGGLVEAVATYRETPDAIGYTYYYYITDIWLNSNIKLLNVNGVLPTHLTITDGTYPIHTAYYAVIRKDEPADSPVRKIIEYLLTDEGQTLLEKAGYVKVK